DGLLCLRLGKRSRVGEPSKIRPVLFEIPDGFLRPDEHNDQLTPLLGFADRLQPYPCRLGCEGAVIAQDVRVVCELLRLADVVPGDVFRVWYASDFGQMIHEWAQEVRSRGPLFHQPRELGIVLTAVGCRNGAAGVLTIRARIPNRRANS